MAMEIIKPPSEYGDRYEMGAMAGAVMAASGIKGAAAVLHAVQGCTIEVVHLRQAGPVIAGNYMPIKETNMGPMESVHGRNVPLIAQMGRELVRERAKQKPELVFVFTGDGPSIIEDDIARAAAIIAEENGVKAIPIDTAAFLGEYSRGTEMVLNAILDHYCKGQPVEERKGINIVAPHLMGSDNWPDDIEEIKRLLRAADVPINHVLFQNISVSQLPEISRAKRNYILSGEDLAEFEERCEDMGMPVWGQDLVLPVGIHNTEEWYTKLAETFGDVKKARAQMDEDMKLVKARTKLEYNASWMLTGMFGKRTAVLGPAPMAAAIARSMFFDFNMRPVVVGLLGLSDEAFQRAEKQLAEMADYLDFEVMENPSYYAWGEKLRKTGVVFAVGHRVDHHLVEGYGIPHVSMTGPYFMSHWDRIPWPYMGIRGSLYLIQEFWKGTNKAIRQTELWQMNRYRSQDEIAAESGNGRKPRAKAPAKARARKAK